MSEYVPLTKAAQLEGLDSNEIVEGYYDGFKNEPEPKGNRSIAYWHGWRNGMVDGGFSKGSPEQTQFAEDYVRTLRQNPTTPYR